MTTKIFAIMVVLVLAVGVISVIELQSADADSQRTTTICRNGQCTTTTTGSCSGCSSSVTIRQSQSTD